MTPLYMAVAFCSTTGFLVVLGAMWRRYADRRHRDAQKTIDDWWVLHGRIADARQRLETALGRPGCSANLEECLDMVEAEMAARRRQ